MALIASPADAVVITVHTRFYFTKPMKRDSSPRFYIDSQSCSNARLFFGLSGMTANAAVRSMFPCQIIFRAPFTPLDQKAAARSSLVLRVAWKHDASDIWAKAWNSNVCRLV